MRTTKPISITHPVLAGHWHYSLNNLMGLGSPDDYTYGCCSRYFMREIMLMNRRIYYCEDVVEMVC